MKIELDTNKDSYDMWKKIQVLVESAYCQPAEALIPKSGVTRGWSTIKEGVVKDEK
jgi:hypothetical protein